MNIQLNLSCYKNVLQPPAGIFCFCLFQTHKNVNYPTLFSMLFWPSKDISRLHIYLFKNISSITTIFFSNPKKTLCFSNRKLTNHKVKYINSTIQKMEFSKWECQNQYSIYIITIHLTRMTLNLQLTSHIWPWPLKS